jgi:hypothetical protein
MLVRSRRQIRQRVFLRAPLVTDSYRKLVPRLTAATCASGTVAFEGFVTRPVIEAFVLCARSAQGYKDKKENQQENGDIAHVFDLAARTFWKY